MEINWLIHIVAALVPMIVGFIWYNPSVFGTTWMNGVGLTEERIRTGNMPMIFGLSFLMALLLSFTYKFLGDHHFAFQAFFRPVEEHGMGVDASSAFGAELQGIIDAYGVRFHTWSHGLAHSIMITCFVLLPVMATVALFERRSFKTFLINWGYWVITIAIMFMILAQWG
ncbi:MAG: DUF1761 domain-containing protein [Flavobacteriales bacterium]|nr:DUF1761 domain-containing protein [Flavobacteriales bacterium]